MKLTETLSPEQCREAMLLLGGQIVLPGGLRVVLDDQGIAIRDTGGVRLGIDAFEAVDVVYIIQVAAEQVVREAGIWITSEFMVQRSGGEARDAASRAGLPIEVGPYPTYLAALLAVLRAIKEQNDG